MVALSLASSDRQLSVLFCASIKAAVLCVCWGEAHTNTGPRAEPLFLGWSRTELIIVPSMEGQQEWTSRRADGDIHHDFQVEWTLGSQDDIQVLLNNKTIQFSYSQGEQDLLLNAKCMWAGPDMFQSPGTSPAQCEGSHPEIH